jgi:hypothetical protein
MQKRLQLPERNAVEAMEIKSAAKSRAGLSWSFSSVTVRYCRPAKGASNCEIVHSRLVERERKKWFFIPTLSLRHCRRATLRSHSSLGAPFLNREFDVVVHHDRSS